MSDCRRITDPAPAPYAVRKSARKSCIQMLAEGYHHANDLCPACTQTFMRALGAAMPNLHWHPNFRARAAEGVAR